MVVPSGEESRAEKELREAFEVRSEGDTKLPCVIHGVNGCSDVQRCHLDESASSGPSSWFFENIVPICGALNRVIEYARSSHLREELIARMVKKLKRQVARVR